MYVYIYIYIYITMREKTILREVYFDVKIGGKEAGRIVIGLYGKKAPSLINTTIYHIVSYTQ